MKRGAFPIELLKTGLLLGSVRFFLVTVFIPPRLLDTGKRSVIILKNIVDVWADVYEVSKFRMCWTRAVTDGGGRLPQDHQRQLSL